MLTAGHVNFGVVKLTGWRQQIVKDCQRTYTAPR